MRLRLHSNSQWKQIRKVAEIVIAIDLGNAALALLGLDVKESCELLKLPNLLMSGMLISLHYLYGLLPGKGRRKSLGQVRLLHSPPSVIQLIGDVG